MNVPFVDLSRIHKPLEKEFTQKFKELLRAGHFVAGGATELFETQWAKYVGAKHALLVNNGTSALYLALEALQLPRGSEVIIPVNTFIATAEAVLLAGYQPIFADVNPETYLLDERTILEKITEQTRAIIFVNLYGQAVSIPELRKKIEKQTKQKIFYIEDSCQSHGAYTGDTPILKSDLACYSFYPGKNLGALGEAGAVVTNNQAWQQRMLLFRGHGSVVKYQHEIVGFNFRAGEMEAAFLSIKLPHLKSYNQKRQKAVKQYYKHLKPLIKSQKIKMQAPPKDESHVYHLFELYVQDREALMQYLQSQGIQSGLHYPHPLHLTPAFAHLGYKKGSFPVAEDLAQHLVSLPLFAGITTKEVSAVCSAVSEFYEKR